MAESGHTAAGRVLDRVGWRDEHETIVVVDFENGSVSTFVGAARFLWLGFAAGLHAAALVENLAGHYGISAEQAEQDVREFTDELAAEGWITPEPR